MVNVITELSRYAMILMLALYTLQGFRLVNLQDEEKEAALWQQNILFFALHFLGNGILYLNTQNEKILYFYGAQQPSWYSWCCSICFIREQINS